MLSTLNDLITLWDSERSEIVRKFEGSQNLTQYLQPFFFNNNGLNEGIMSLSENGQLVYWNIQEGIQDSKLPDHFINIQEFVKEENDKININSSSSVSPTGGIKKLDIE